MNISMEENDEVNNDEDMNEKMMLDYFLDPSFHPPPILYNDHHPILPSNYYSYETAWDQYLYPNIVTPSPLSPQTLYASGSHDLPPTANTLLGRTAPYNKPINVDQAPRILDFSSWAEDKRHRSVCVLYDDIFEEHHGVLEKKRVSSSGNRTESQAQDHLVAEKKRRENLRHLFIRLSKVVPGIKKLDKASLLEDAINHLKGLQERVRLLEEEEQIKNGCSAPTTTRLSSTEAPEIWVRISNKQVLIKICCGNQYPRMMMMSKIPCEIQKMNLFSVIDMRFIVFGGAALCIIILAQMENEVGGSKKLEDDIVSHLRSVLISNTTSE